MMTPEICLYDRPDPPNRLTEEGLIGNDGQHCLCQLQVVGADHVDALPTPNLVGTAGSPGTEASTAGLEVGR